MLLVGLTQELEWKWPFLVGQVNLGLLTLQNLWSMKSGLDFEAGRERKQPTLWGHPWSESISAKGCLFSKGTK